MKTALKLALILFTALSVFPSCKSFQMMHYNKSELDKVGPNMADYTVYIHDKNNTYQVVNPSMSTAGVKGSLSQVEDKAAIAEIKNPRTRKQFKKHKHDLNIYTKSEIKDNNSEVVLKKDEVSDVSHLSSKAGGSIGEDIATGFVLSLGVVVWGGLVYSLHGML